MEWTAQQQQVIDARNQNILVSAAAGSGKTAVLTERILRIVADRNHPVDIDRLVVVTFTKAAAGEMRERILKALQAEAEQAKNKEVQSGDREDGEWYEYLQRQLSFIHNARITTIDSFCLDIVRDHFSELNIDPSFKVGEEGELKLIQADVMAELLEDYYTEGKEEFLDFVDIYSSNRDDLQIEDMILQLYGFSVSHPYPESWIQECAKKYLEQREDFEQEEWYQVVGHRVDARLSDILNQIKTCLAVTEEEDGPMAYEPAILSDQALVKDLVNAKGYENRRQIFLTLEFEQLSRKKQPDALEEKKNYVKSCRDEYKKQLKKLSADFFSQTKEEIRVDLSAVGTQVQVLTELTLEFSKRYAEAKLEKNLVDFSDLEHFALRILMGKGEEPTEIARHMSEEIEEIMIDEYQDSNYVQEMILKTISGNRRGIHNLFMVGDVKQSIYKFRMAKPELFLEKYDRFLEDGTGPDRKMILSRNFRSRNGVLQFTNQVFQKLMTRAVGGIVYDEDSALYYGAQYEGEDDKTELHLLNLSEEKEEPEELNDDLKAQELEAQNVALYIRKMYQEKYQVTDKETKEKRPMRYSDVAVLLRGMGTWGEAYERAFRAEGIPVRCPVKKGRFDSFEVTALLEYLTIIDNPRQDIPLAAVLKNIFLFSEEELAQIRIGSKNSVLYDALKAFGEQEEAGTERQDMHKRVQRFLALLEKYRKENTYLTIYDLLNHILADTGFEYYIGAFPDGRARMQNIAMLKERASVYQQGSYSGLFHFVRYIEKNKQYEIQQETVSSTGSGDEVVMMTIHKSKGLEYPIVIVGGLGKQFNTEDTKKKVVLHPELGIGMDRYDVQRSIKSKTLIKACVAAKIKEENLAEELRVLYVAFTRAKEKLVLFGTGKFDNKWEKYKRHAGETGQGTLSVNTLLSANNYLDLLLPVLINEQDYQGEFPFCRIMEEKTGEIAFHEIETKQEEREWKKKLEDWDVQKQYSVNLRERIEAGLEYQYPYREDMDIKAKATVTDLKEQLFGKADEETDTGEKLGEETDDTEPVPKFAQEVQEKTAGGTRLGTAYHKVFELLDYTRDYKQEDQMAEFIKGLTESHRISQQAAAFIRPAEFLRFLQSKLGQRMKAAYLRGQLFREQQFVMEIPGTEVYADYQGTEKVLVQGMIDAYFEEDGKVYVVDYKTDRVENAEELKERYRMQLQLYGRAVSMILGKELGGCMIYSVRKGAVVEV